MSSGSYIDVFAGTENSQIDIQQNNLEIASLENENNIIEQSNQKIYAETLSLKDHIENSQQYSGRSGIKGAHNKNEFLKTVNEIDAKIIAIQQNSQILGVQKISYKMPLKDKAGNLTGKHQSKVHYKTVYNPKIISTDSYIERGIQAANNSTNKNSQGLLYREWTGIDNNGVSWHGYCDSSGTITSFYPED